VLPDAQPPFDPHHHVPIEHRDQAFEVSARESCEKRFDDLSMFGNIGVCIRFSGLNPAPRTAGKLPGGFRCSIHDRGNLVERHSVPARSTAAAYVWTCTPANQNSRAKQTSAFTRLPHGATRRTSAMPNARPSLSPKPSRGSAIAPAAPIVILPSTGNAKSTLRACRPTGRSPNSRACRLRWPGPPLFRLRDREDALHLSMLSKHRSSAVKQNCLDRRPSEGARP